MRLYSHFALILYTLKFALSIKPRVEMGSVYQGQDYAMGKMIVTMVVTKIIAEVIFEIIYDARHVLRDKMYFFLFKRIQSST